MHMKLSVFSLFECHYRSVNNLKVATSAPLTAMNLNALNIRQLFIMNLLGKRVHLTCFELLDSNASSLFLCGI